MSSSVINSISKGGDNEDDGCVDLLLWSKTAVNESRDTVVMLLGEQRSQKNSSLLDSKVESVTTTMVSMKRLPQSCYQSTRIKSQRCKVLRNGKQHGVMDLAEEKHNDYECEETWDNGTNSRSNTDLRTVTASSIDRDEYFGYQKTMMHESNQSVDAIQCHVRDWHGILHGHDQEIRDDDDGRIGENHSRSVTADAEDSDSKGFIKISDIDERHDCHHKPHHQFCDNSHLTNSDVENNSKVRDSTQENGSLLVSLQDNSVVAFEDQGELETGLDIVLKQNSRIYNSSLTTAIQQHQTDQHTSELTLVTSSVDTIVVILSFLDAFSLRMASQVNRRMHNIVSCCWSTSLSSSTAEPEETNVTATARFLWNCMATEQIWTWIPSNFHHASPRLSMERSFRTRFIDKLDSKGTNLHTNLSYQDYCDNIKYMEYQTNQINSRNIHFQKKKESNVKEDKKVTPSEVDMESYPNLSKLIALSASSSPTTIDYELLHPCKWNKRLQRHRRIRIPAWLLDMSSSTNGNIHNRGMFLDDLRVVEVQNSISTNSKRSNNSTTMESKTNRYGINTPVVPVVKYIGVVGAGNRCIRANHPLPKPLCFSQQKHKQLVTREQERLNQYHQHQEVLQVQRQQLENQFLQHRYQDQVLISSFFDHVACITTKLFSNPFHLKSLGYNSAGKYYWKPFVYPFVTRYHRDEDSNVCDEDIGDIDNENIQVTLDVTPRLVSYYEVTIVDTSSEDDNLQNDNQNNQRLHEIFWRSRQQNQLVQQRPPPDSAQSSSEDCVAVGLAFNEFDLHFKMPGWDTVSFGYHGDDGCFFHGTGHPRRTAFGPKFGKVGDTVGCGVDYHMNAIFYTLNGNFVGYAPCELNEQQIHQDFYPVVGVDSKYGVLCNFGTSIDRPFVFDLTAKLILPRHDILTNSLL